MHEILIRNADTGHSHSFSNVDCVDTLSQLIFQNLKVDVPDQLIISKNGLRITSKSPLEADRILKETFVSDQHSKNSSKKQFCLYLFNLRNLAKKRAEIPDPETTAQDCKVILSRMHECSLNLREKSYELKPLKQNMTDDKLLKVYAYNAEIPEMAQKLHSIISKFVNNFNEIKENKECLNSYTELYENQRKGINVLFKHMKNMTNEIKQTHREYESQIDQLYSTYANSSKPNKNSPALIRQIEAQKETIQMKKISITSENQKLKVLLRDFFQKFSISSKENERVMKSIDSFIDKVYKEVQSDFGQIKSTFNKLTDAVKEKFQKGSDEQDKNIKLFLTQRAMYEQKFMAFVKKSSEMIGPTQERFYQIFRMYKEQQNSYRTYYKNFCDISQSAQKIKQKYQSLQASMKEIGKKIVGLCMPESYQGPLEQNWVSDPVILHKVPSKKSDNSNQSIGGSLQENASIVSSLQDKRNLNENIQNRPKLANQLSNVVEREEKQLQRRKYFNRKLIALNEELKIILKEEQGVRKSFISTEISFNQFYHHPILENINVPSFLLNFDETTDRDLTFNASANKSGLQRFDQKERNEVDLSFYHSDTGMDRVLLQLDIIKNCQINLRKESGGLQGKVKNLQTIIEKSADVFHHVYTHKIAQVQKKHQNRERHMEFRIGNLERQNVDLQQKLKVFAEKQNSDNTEKIWLEQKVQNLITQLENLRKTNYEEAIRRKQQAQKHESDRKKLQQKIEDLEKKKNTFKANEEKLQEFTNKQINMIESLAVELEESSLRIRELEDLNTEYKIVMGDQQVRIASLQSQAGIGEGEGKNLQASFYGGHLNTHTEKTEVNKEQQEKERQVPEGEDVPISDFRKDLVRKPLKFQDSVYGALELEITSLKQELQELKSQNQSLNEELMKIAMKDTQDQAVQVQPQTEITNKPIIGNESSMRGQTSNYSLFNPIAVTQYQQVGAIVTKEEPKEGELRVFIPYTSGVYVAVVSNNVSSADNSMTTYETGNLSPQQAESHPFVLDLNPLSVKARQLLKECTLIVVVKITKILPGADRWYVQGEIESAMGFEDDDMKLKDYGTFLKRQ